MLHLEFERFRIADPTMVEAVVFARRHESKRLLRRDAVPQLLAALQPDYALVSSADKLVARYETLYFDTLNDDLYRDHHRGIAPRSKIRVRDYLDRDLSFLEIKTKQADSTTFKERRARPLGLASLNSAELRFLTQACPRLAGRGALVPSLFTSFQRITLVRRDSAERLTLDLCPEFETAEGRVRFENLVIIEAKTHTVSATARETGSVAGFSKYCLGRAILSETLPIQGFVSKLRRATKLAGSGTHSAPERNWQQLQSLGAVLA